MTRSSSTISRRIFLERASAIASLAGCGFAAQLAQIGAASAQSNDYKALVCLFQFGGNDHANTVTPTSATEYNRYFNTRQTLALAQNALRPITPQGFAGPSLGIHPALANVQELFETGEAAIIANVGTLVRQVAPSPSVSSADLPTPLFSHSDQQGFWQTGLPDRPSLSGWLGRVADQVNSGFNAGARLSMNISVAGNTVSLAGNNVIPYQLASSGPRRVNGLSSLYGSRANAEALRRMMTQNGVGVFENESGAIHRRAIDTAEFLVDALAVAPPLATTFPTMGLGAQLSMVARMIALRNTLGHNRQIFFVSSGGWDFHQNLLEDQQIRLSEVDAAVGAFAAAMRELRLFDRVTLFTASDFGRKLQFNGRGSDHGWGGHHFAIGGAVRGRRVYGQWAEYALGTPEDRGGGALFPTTSVDAYSATLARWFGVADSALSTVIPNIDRFPSNDLGFMAAPNS
jgi:uncharacterized protein (DUF1501 family)